MNFLHNASVKWKTFLLFAMTSALLPAAEESVKVSDFKPDRANATAAVQKAIDSGAKQVIFDNPGFDYIVEPIFLRSNQELIFEDGVHVRALPGGFKGRNDCLFQVIGVENLVMRGEGRAVLSMNKKDYQDPKRYALGEWRHAIALIDCRNVTIKDLTIRSSGGDGVYISRRSAPLMENNILLEHLLLDDHHRQGISVTSVNGLVIRNCRIQNTIGTAPMCGIDFEPNDASEEVTNCLIEGTEFLNNAYAGIMFCCPHLSRPLGVTVRNCRIAGNRGGIYITDAKEGSARFENCQIIDDPQPLVIRDEKCGLAMSFSGCEIDNRSGKAEFPVRILTKFRENCGGIDFGQLIIRQDPKRPVISFAGYAGAGLELPKGEITVIAPDETRSVFDLKKFAEEHGPNPDLLNFETAPVNFSGCAPVRRKKNPFNLRETVFFVQYCDGKAPVKLRFRTTWKANNALPPKVEIFDPAGAPYGRFSIDKDDFTYELKGGRGVYKFCLDTRAGRSAINIESSAPGFGFMADSQLNLFRCTGTFYFHVPAGATTFAIRLRGSPGEPVEAELVDPSGKVRASARSEADSQLLKAERPENSPGEIWSLRIPFAVEDYDIRLGAPLPPVLYTFPEDTLVPGNQDF